MVACEVNDMERKKTNTAARKQSVIGYYRKYGWKTAGRDLLYDVRTYRIVSGDSRPVVHE